MHNCCNSTVLEPTSNGPADYKMLLQVLGTPTEDNWPGISRSEELSGYKFPAYSPESLVSKAPRLDTDGVSLLSSFLLFEAKKRLPAREALKHPYFSSFPQEIALLKDGNISCINFKENCNIILPKCLLRSSVWTTCNICSLCFSQLG